MKSGTHNEVVRLDYDASIQEAVDRMRFQQEIGLTACKSVILVNGGAIIGLLTFIGNHPAIHDPVGLKLSVYAFSIGIGCALVSLICGYMGQNWLADLRLSMAWNYQREMKGEPWAHDVSKSQTMAWALMIAASSLVMAGITAFIFGAVTSANAIL